MIKFIQQTFLPQKDESLNHRHRHRHRKGHSSPFFSFFGTKDLCEVASVNEGNNLENNVYPLSMAKSGASVWIFKLNQGGGNSRLLGMGLTPKLELKVVHCQPSGSVIIEFLSTQIGLGAEVAQNILVTDQPLNRGELTTMTTVENRTYLRELPVGAIARVVGYDKTMRSYKGKLLSMGLTPKTEFEIIRVAPLGDPIEIKVRGFHLTLRKQEADAVIIDVISPLN